jgi:hypothetical protein
VNWAKKLEKRRLYCERLQDLIEKANPEFSESAFEKPPNVTKENPFYQALNN